MICIYNVPPLGGLWSSKTVVVTGHPIFLLKTDRFMFGGWMDGWVDEWMEKIKEKGKRKKLPEEFLHETMNIFKYSL